MKIISIIGTRPEIIKMSCLFELLDKNYDHKIIHSGQHYDPNLDKVIFKELQLKSKIKRLNTGSGNFGEQFSKQLLEIFKALSSEMPKYVIVQGDTNTALAGALVAARLKIKIIHVEAGCRSGNLAAPEEQNRILIDSISHLHLCPDHKTYKNLIKEGHQKSTVVSGSTTFDAINRSGSLASDKILRELKLKEGNFILCTLHRAENMEDLKSFKEKILFVNWLSEYMPVVFPVHPRTQKFLKDNDLLLGKNVLCLEPLSHLRFVALLKNCRLVASDSGGIQEEAAFFNRPCLVLRNETEWTRLIKVKKNFLFPEITKKEKKFVHRLLTDKKYYEVVRSRKCKESKAGASLKIVSAIKKLK